MTGPPPARTGLPRLPVRGLARQLPEPGATTMRTEDATAEAVRIQLTELALLDVTAIAALHTPTTSSIERVRPALEAAAA